LLIAQQISSIQLSEKDDLPDIEFYNIIQDSKRFIWLAADNGLYRYNGKAYEHFKHPLEKGNAVFGVFEDDKARVWCNNISGQFFYVENGKMELFIDLFEQLKGQLREFIVTPNELVVFTSDNIIRVDLETKSISEQFDQPKLVGNIQRHENGYAHLVGDFIKHRDRNFKTIDSFYIGSSSKFTKQFGLTGTVGVALNEKIKFLYFNGKGVINIYTYGIKGHKLSRLKIPKPLKSRKINYIFNQNSKFWILTDLGIFICNYHNGALKLEQRLFKKDYTTKIIVDHEENFWLATKGNGIKIMPNIHVSQFNIPSSQLNISAIEKVDDSTVITGTKQGVGSILHVRKNKIKIVDSSSAYRISEILYNAASDNVLWFREEKSIQINFKSGTLSEIPNANFNGAKSVSLTNEGKYLLSTYRSAEIYKPNFELERTVFKKRSYTNWFSEARNTAYFASVDGLYAFDHESQLFEILFKNRHLYVNVFSETNDGSIWVGTFKNGLYRVKGKKAIQRYGVNEGLLSEKITALQSDDNELWVATEKGVQVLNIFDGTIKNLTKKNGIPSYRITGIVNLDETMVFASNNGLFQVDKEKAFKTEKVPEVYFTEVIFGSENKTLKNEYKLEHDQNSIEIGFNSNGFESFENNRYAYRMLGENEDWTFTKIPTSSVAYGNLHSGNYTFQLMPLMNGKRIDTQMISLNFKIESPFWEQWWFYVIVVSSIGILVYLLFKRQINKLKRKQTEELEREKTNQILVGSQLENLRSQMNPHFIFNALNSIQEYIVLNEKDLASSYLIKFSRLIRIYLEHSRKNEVTLKEELRALNIYLELEKNRFEDLLNYDISVGDEVNVSEVKVPSLFIQPYVENALKHGLLHKKKDRRLNILFQLNANKTALICVIQDNGIGIEASMKINERRNGIHKSFATNAIKERVDLLNVNRKYKISVETKSKSASERNGTEVTITIPFENSLTAEHVELMNKD